MCLDRAFSWAHSRWSVYGYEELSEMWNGVELILAWANKEQYHKWKWGLRKGESSALSIHGHGSILVQTLNGGWDFKGETLNITRWTWTRYVVLTSRRTCMEGEEKASHSLEREMHTVGRKPVKSAGALPSTPHPFIRDAAQFVLLHKISCLWSY